MNRYHFDLGNSSTGPIGCSAVIMASSPEKALSRLRELLPHSIEVDFEAKDAEEYIEIYFTPENITTAAIDTVEKDVEAFGCSECDVKVYPGDDYFATPCGTFCNDCMPDHCRECGVCNHEFGLITADEEESHGCMSDNCRECKGLNQ